MEYKVGDQIGVRINRIQENGCFCSFHPLRSNLYGFMPKYLMSSMIDAHNNYFVSVGDDITVVIYKITDNRFLLSDVETYDKEQFISKYEVGTIFEAEVIRVLQLNATVKVGNVEGIIEKKDTNWNVIESLDNSLFEGEIIKVVYLGYDNKQLFFSTKLLNEKPYDEKLYDLSLEELLKYIGHKSNEFIGQAKQYGSRIFIENLYSCDDNQKGKLLIDPIYGYNLRALVPNSNFGVDIDHFYKIKLQLVNKGKRLERNQLFQFYATDIIDSFNPYKADVDLTFEKSMSPRDCSALAHTLAEVGKNMYSSKDRMFFELIQNADDAASEKGVFIKVKTDGDFLLVQHNGNSFDKDDFDAITSSANGTKKANENKTGYKGIGFKSVFTDSEIVYIKTGGYQFKFDKHYPIFNNFESFYFSVNGLSSEQQKASFLTKFSSEYNKFRGVADIPWQLEPIWVDSFPEQFSDSFVKSNVAIALKIGENKILGDNGYCKAIDDIISNPKFMLFLRNTKRIDFNGKTVSKGTKDDVITLKNSFKSNKVELFKRIDFLIDVNNDVFEKNNIDVRIKVDEKEESTGKIIEAKFVDIHNQEIENIPKKIAINNATTISFAISIDENGMLNPDSKCSDISLFAFLPTLVKDFMFPFYINANFILDPPRQRVLGDNPWNFYLMQEIARRMVSWCATLSKQRDKNALNILITDFFDENSPDIRQLASHFNATYKFALETQSFILNHKGELSRQDEIIIDKTGLSEIIGADLLCKIIGTDKCLPSNDIDSKILSEEIFSKIEKITKVIDLITGNEQFNEWFISSSDEEKTKLYDWIVKQSKTIERIERLKKLIARLPLYKFGDTFRNFFEIDSDSTLVITTDHIEPIKEILYKIGFECSDNSFDDKLPIYVFLNEQDEKALFESIKKCDFSSLDFGERKILFYALKEFEGVGESKIKDIPLFRNLNGNFKPLGEMTVYMDIVPIWLRAWVICQEDYCKDFDSFLIKSENVFDDIVKDNFSDFANVSITELYDTYSTQWNAMFTKHLIDKLGATYQLLDIVERTDGAKDYFIKRFGKVYLPKSKDSVYYRVVKMALENNIPIKEQIYVNDKPLSDYTISDDVVIEINGNKYVFSLSELLPEYKKTSGALQSVKQLLSDIDGYEKLFSLSTMDVSVIWHRIQMITTKSLPQIAFYICYNVKQSYRYNLSCTTFWFVSIMKYCYQKKYDFLAKYIGNVTSPIIVGKFINSDDYTIQSERLLTSISSWADDDDKQRFLISLGVKSNKSDEIKRRKSFVNNEQMYLGNLEKSEIMAFLNWAKTLQTPFTGDYQIAVLQEMFKRVGQDTQYDFNDYRIASEWDNDNYRQNIRNKIKIYCLPHQTPKRGIYDGVHLFTEYCGDNVYFTNYSSLYVDNSNNQIEQILLKVSDKGISPFTKDDWHKLFSVNRNDYEKLEQEKKKLEREIEKLKRENNGLLSEVQTHGRYSGKDGVQEDDRKSINREARIAAKDYLLQFDDYDVSDWEPEESGQIVKDVVTYKGQPITVVVTSSRASKLYLHPRVFVELMQQPENLLLNYDGKVIHSLSFDNVFKDNPNVNLIFDADVITDDEFAKLASRYMYTRKTCFVIENPRYSIFDEIQSFGLEKTNEDIEVDTDFSDDDLFNF